jgi:hypothetical protein
MRTITIELPDDLLPRLRETPESLGREMPLAMAIHWLRRGRISPDEAAAIAGLGRLQFDAALAQIIASHDGGHAPLTVEPASSGAPADEPLSSEVAEAHYQVLGAWKLPAAAKDVQRAARVFWLGAGSSGARWLVARLRGEVILDRMHGAASMLADLGEACVGPIFETLSGDSPRDQVQALLWALVSLIESEPALQLEGAREELVLAELLQHDDPDLRESAARAMGLLRPDRAVRWLERRQRVAAE